ncbi:MAG: MFS transporter, partial [Chthoniobacteraceae bacterium]
GSAQQAAKWASGLVAATNATTVFDWSFGLMPKASIIEIVVILTSLGAIVATVVAPLIADRAGRRITYAGLCIASLATALAFFKTNHAFTGDTLTPWLYISAFLLGGITASFYGFFPLYFPELFPTSVRATAQGFCFNFGRVIAAVGALQLGNLIGIFGTQANAYSILSCVYLVGTVVVWLGPETKGQPLPD